MYFINEYIIVMDTYHYMLSIINYYGILILSSFNNLTHRVSNDNIYKRNSFSVNKEIDEICRNYVRSDSYASSYLSSDGSTPTLNRSKSDDDCIKKITDGISGIFKLTDNPIFFSTDSPIGSRKKKIFSHSDKKRFCFCFNCSDKIFLEPLKKNGLLPILYRLNDTYVCKRCYDYKMSSIK